MSITAWSAMGLLAISVLVGSIGAAFAYQIGRPSTVAVFDFAYVGFAAAWGFLFFGEVPGHLTLVGMALIMVAGTLAVLASAHSGPD